MRVVMDPKNLRGAVTYYVITRREGGGFQMLTGDDRGEGGGLRFADVSENIEFSKFENTISKLFRS